MRILITGYKGFIGSNMMKACASEGWEVEGYDWDDDFFFPDVGDYDWVIHLGAIADINETDVEKVLSQNLDFSKWLFRECLANNVNFQFASSSSVYGMTENFSESSNCHPDNPYAWSKYLFDRWVKNQINGYIIFHGFRYFNVYGENMHLRGDRANVVHKWTEQARNDDFIEIYEDGHINKRDFTYVGDVCKLHIDFIKNVKKSDIWNCGSGKAYTYKEIANTIASKENVNIQYKPIPNPETFRKYTCADLTKLEETIGKREWVDVLNWISELKYSHV